MSSPDARAVVDHDADSDTIFVSFRGFGPGAVNRGADGLGVSLSRSAALAACEALGDPRLDSVWDRVRPAEGPSVFPEGDGVQLEGFGRLGSVPGALVLGDMSVSQAKALREQLAAQCAEWRKDGRVG
ncbi:hypothetical protein [Candidatus Poriferisodalis sp.]|uniref:hypothetical protein n=1 Tax=Candidatus Poriferisodalis sp. TaxID=3101277 RepID=UPI003B530225